LFAGVCIGIYNRRCDSHRYQAAVNSAAQTRLTVKKTHSMRLLESHGIPYSVHQFPSHVHSAAEVAEILGVPTGQVYKTLVVVRERGRPLLVLVPGDKALDLKLLAKAAGEKKLRMATHGEAEALTGLRVGGISALALLHKHFDLYADEAILSLPQVLVSAGRRGIDLSLQPDELVRVTKARLVRVTRS
jgi:Cys-tRNA(Pro)/Cys-tRNA(Cys) deacylase